MNVTNENPQAREMADELVRTLSAQADDLATVTAFARYTPPAGDILDAGCTGEITGLAS